MRRTLISSLPIAAVSAAVLLFPHAAGAANTATSVSLYGWAAPAPATSGAFSATSKTLCNSGSWATSSVNNNGFLTLTCSNGTDSITFAQGLAKYKGKTTGVFNVQSGTGAYANPPVSGQLYFVQDSGTTGILSGNIS